MASAPDSLFENEIYEAAVIPEQWPNVLDRLGDMAGSLGSVLFSTTEKGAKWLASPSLNARMERFIAEGWIDRNSRAINGFRKGLALEPRFLTERDLFDGDEYERDPLYLEYFRPNGMGWSAGTMFALPHGDFLTLTVERAYANGPIPDTALAHMDAARPHLARSAMMAARLSFERARTAVETLSMLGLPAFAVASNGRLLVANRDFEQEIGAWTTRGGDRLVLLDERANRVFNRSLESIGTTAGIRSIPLFGAETDERAVLHIIPVRRSAHDIFGDAAAIAMLTTASTKPVGAFTLLQALFDLTPHEARIAAQIASGMTAEEIAAAERKTILTVRQQLKTVLAKTGCRRQADLVRVLVRLVPPSM